MIVARQATARSYIIGPVLDADGVAVTNLTASAFKISKNGAAPAALNGSATATHQHTGHYLLALTASDHSAVGVAQVGIDSTTNTCGRLDLQVVEEAIFDAMFAASANGIPEALDTLLDAIQAKTDLIAQSGLFVNTPLLPGGRALLFDLASYNATTNNRLGFPLRSNSPDASDDGCVLHVIGDSNEIVAEITGDVEGTVGSQIGYVSIVPATDLAALDREKDYRYRAYAVYGETLDLIAQNMLQVSY